MKDVLKDDKSKKKIIIANSFSNKKFFNLDNFNKYFKITKYENTCLYFNTKGTNINNYLDSKCKDFSFIFKGCNMSVNKKRRLLMITINSLGTKYTNYYSISEDKFNYIANNYIKYNENLIYKEDGIILIYLNNSKGWYRKYINMYKLEDIIKKIRKYVNNKIVIRLHKRDFINKKLISYIKSLSKYNTSIDMQGKKWSEIMKETYCVFIQNSSTIFELFSYGIPLFSLEEIISLNLYEDCYLSTEYIKDLSKYDIDRKTILKRYYSHMLFHKNPSIISKFITELYEKYYA